MKVNLIFKVSQTKRHIFHFGPTWSIKNEVRMEKLLQGVTSLRQSFEMNLMQILFCYISQAIGQLKFVDTFTLKM